MPSPDGSTISHPDTHHAAAHAALNAALESMPYGFGLWDDDFRLILCNTRFLELYKLDRADAQPGAGLVAVFGASPEIRDPRKVRDQLAAATKDGTFVTEETLSGGRVVKVSFRHTDQRGWIATHEDVTEQRDQMLELQQRESQLAQQNFRFEAAVDNMSQGLCMFDNQWRLVICNKRYAEFYDTPAALVKPGTRLETILRDRVRRGYFPEGDPESFVQRRIAAAVNASAGTDVVELRDGRVIAIVHHPMADGGWVSTHQDITEQRRTDERILHLARHDTLTGLPNRMYFRERMELAERQIANRETIAVLIVDLDHYKSINDVFGHGIGDAVLVEVASRLTAVCTGDNIVARLGGDEFAILQVGISSAQDARKLAEQVVRLVAEPMAIESHEVVIGASVGIAVAPRDGRDTSVLMRNADLALYRAKSEGRNTYQFFEPAMNTALQKRLTIETELRSALAAGEFALAFQPFLNLAQHRISGFEALLRWNHPTRGVVMPEDMIVIAEETGLIIPIGEWVLRTACAEAAQWPDHVQLSVNLSPVQFRNRDLAERVAAILAETGLSPRRLELEITEPELFSETKVTIETLLKLRRTGVTVVLDDFGAGHASLGFLRSFPFDKVKIDRAFVGETSDQPNSAPIVGAIIDLGKSLGMSTSAAGIETEAQLHLVRAHGCTEIQGHLLSPPLPPGAVTTLLAEAGGDTNEAARRLER